MSPEAIYKHITDTRDRGLRTLARYGPVGGDDMEYRIDPGEPTTMLIKHEDTLLMQISLVSSLHEQIARIAKGEQSGLSLELQVHVNTQIEKAMRANGWDGRLS
jgi:hypothetical protein